MRRYIQIENVTLKYANFKGKPNKYNPDGNRHFHVALPENAVVSLVLEGLNIREVNGEKLLQVRLPRVRESDTPLITVNTEHVTVEYGLWDCGNLDDVVNQSQAQLRGSVTIILRPWNVQDNKGVAAFLYEAELHTL